MSDMDQYERDAEVQRSLGRIEGKLDLALAAGEQNKGEIKQVSERTELALTRVDSRVTSLEKSHWKNAGMVAAVAGGATFIFGPLWEWLKTHLK